MKTEPQRNLSYDEILVPLRESYDSDASNRDSYTKDPWKVAERAAFLDRLDRGQKLLEIGAGTGQDSAFFVEHGLEVVATDLSAGMVAFCRAKGIDARVMDFLSLDFPPQSFDAVWALNCLLHVPNADLPRVLSAVHRVMKPGALFFIGVYGGDEFEGIHEQDHQVPKRFFSRRTDDQLKAFVGAQFEIAEFHPVVEGTNRLQVLIARRPETTATPPLHAA